MQSNSGRNELKQEDLILAHLQEEKTLSPMEAVTEYGVWRLAAVIHKLRAKGYKIVTHNTKSKTGKTFAEYELLGKTADPKQEYDIGVAVEVIDTSTNKFKEGDIVEIVEFLGELCLSVKGPLSASVNDLDMCQIVFREQIQPL